MTERKPRQNTHYKNEFNARNYDSLRIVVPKGQKEAVEAHAKANGKTVNGLVNALLRADMGVSEAEWKRAADGGDTPARTEETPEEAPMHDN